MHHQLAEQRQLIEKLNHQLSQLQRMIFGQKSEKRTSENKEDKSTHNENVSTNKRSSHFDQQKEPNGKRPLPSDLEHIKVKHDIREDKRFCSSSEKMKLHCVGKGVSEQLDFIPPKLFFKQGKVFTLVPNFLLTSIN